MTSLPKFAPNGWRRHSNGILEHVSGLQFEPDQAGGMKLVQSSLLVFIENVKNEGVSQEQAERLLKKLTIQAKEHFIGLLH